MRVSWVVVGIALAAACGGEPARIAAPRNAEAAASSADRLASAWFELHSNYSPLARPIGMTRLGQGDRVSDQDRARIAAAARLARELLAREQGTIERVGGPACAAASAPIDAREDGRVVMDTLALFEEALGAGFLPGGEEEARCAAVRVDMAGAWTEQLWTLQGRDRQAAIEASADRDPEIAELVRRARELGTPLTAQMRGGPPPTRAQIHALADFGQELGVEDDDVAALRAMDPARPGMPPPWLSVLSFVGRMADARAARNVQEGGETRRARELYDALRRGWRDAVEHGRTHDLPNADDLPFDLPPTLDHLAAACAGEPIEPEALLPDADSCVRAPR